MVRANRISEWQDWKVRMVLCLVWAIYQAQLITAHDLPTDFQESKQLVSCEVTDSCEVLAKHSEPFKPVDSDILSEWGCPKNEPSLDNAFAYWEGWKEKLHPNVFNEFCLRLPGNKINAGRLAPLYAFHIVLYKREVYVSCCDTHISCKRLLKSHFRDHRDLRESIGVLQDLITVLDIDTQFLLAFGDEPFTSQVFYSNVPLFHPSGSEAYWTIPWPSVYHIRALVNGVLDNRTTGSVAWHLREPRLWWRGSMIAPSTTLLSTAHFHPRMRLTKIANQFPWLFDVAFSGVHQTLESQWGEKNVQTILKEIHARFVDHEDFWEHAPKFKFLLVAPGVTQSHQLSHVLRSGSVPLIVSDVTFEHLFPLLLPWKHYVPVQPNLSDLVPVLEKLLQDDALAHGIASAAQQLASERLRPTGTYCYLSAALKRLQNITGRHSSLAEMISSFTHIRVDLAKDHSRFLPLQKRIELKEKWCHWYQLISWCFTKSLGIRMNQVVSVQVRCCLKKQIPWRFGRLGRQRLHTFCFAGASFVRGVLARGEVSSKFGIATRSKPQKHAILQYFTCIYMLRYCNVEYTWMCCVSEESKIALFSARICQKSQICC